MDKAISDVSLRKLTGIKGETKVVAIGGGLQLWVTVNQAGQTLKSWVLRYYDAQGKRQKARRGTYPELSLAKAQAAAEDLKKQAKDGVNIAQARAQERRVKIEGTQEAQAAQQNTFEVVAEMWLEKKALTWVRAGQIPELGRQHRPEQGAGGRDGHEMVAEQYGFIGYHIVVPVREAYGGRGSGVAEDQHVFRQK